MPRAGPLHTLRSLIVRTSALPIVGAGYRLVYEHQAERAKRLLRGIDGVRAVFVRASNPAGIAPGLSDIDVVVVLDEECSVTEELGAIERIGGIVRRLNRVAPLVREVHVFTRRELAILGRLHHGLYGLLVDAAPIQGDGAATFTRLPPLGEAPVAREALLRELCFRTSRTLLHLFDDTTVGRGLAARAHAKSLAALRELESGVRSTAGLWRAYARGERVPAQYEDVLVLLRRIDMLLPDMPRLVDARPRSVVEAVAAASASIAPWFSGLARHPAVRAALVSVEGARATDLRFYVAVEPTHPAAVDALRKLGEAHASGDFPGRGFSRFPWPIVVTPKQLERTVFHRWTGAEPVARLRHGQSLHGELVLPRASKAEIVRGMVLDGIGSAARLRELLAGDGSRRTIACVRDALFGLSPALARLADSGEIDTEMEPSAPGLAEFRRAFRHAASRADGLRRVRNLVVVCERLLDGDSEAGLPARMT